MLCSSQTITSSMVIKTEIHLQILEKRCAVLWHGYMKSKSCQVRLIFWTTGLRVTLSLFGMKLGPVPSDMVINDKGQPQINKVPLSKLHSAYISKPVLLGHRDLIHRTM